MTNSSAKLAGTLYIVATPIGNLDDLSARAIKVLDRVGLVAAEDTRRCARLLAHCGIEQKTLSLHEHNEDAKTGDILARLGGGEDVALVSDAGTPLISDPGARLVREAIAAGYAVVPVPGPSAPVTALSAAGLPTDRFAFEGFLPRKSAQRKARLEEIARDPRTLIFFESVHRVAESLADITAVFGAERQAVIARELTKLHEQLARGPLGELAAAVGTEIPLKGEFVILVSGAETENSAGDDEVQRVYGLLASEMPPGRAVAVCAAITGRSRNEVYALTRARDEQQ